jgi:hypothetical protein
VSLDLFRFDDMLHGFCSMVNLFERADEAVDAVGQRVRAALRAATTLAGPTALGS